MVDNDSFPASEAPCEVTVAIPAYKPRFFEQALQSALSQEGVDFEVLVCDDSRDDEIEAIVRQLAAASSKPVRYERNRSRFEEAGNVHRCIALARGRFVKLLYDDDWLAPGCLRRQADVLRSRPDVALVSGRRINIDDEGAPLPDYLPSYYPFPGDCCLNGEDVVAFLGNYPINFIGEPVAAMFRYEDARPLLDEGVFSLLGDIIHWFGDVAFYVKLLRQGHLAMLAEPLARFRISSEQFSQRGRDKPGIGQDGHDLFKRHLKTLGWCQGPRHDIGIRPLAEKENAPFVPFDLVAHWQSWLDNDQKAKGGQGSAYVHWIGHMRNELRCGAAAHKVAAGAALHLSVAVSRAGGDEAALQRTRDSLTSQTRPADEWRIAESGADVWAGLADGWTLLLCAGDVLEPHALWCLEDAVRVADRQAACLVCFDHDEWHSAEDMRNPCLKPGWNPDLLWSLPYTGRALLVRNEWAQRHAGPDAGVLDLVLGYRLALAAAERGPGALIHVPMVLAHLTPTVPHLFVADSENWQRLAVALQGHLAVWAPGAQLLEGPGPGTFHVIHPLPRAPKVSIVIPTRDQLPALSRCVESLLDQTNYPDFEILVVDNDSQTPEAQAFLAGLEALGDSRIRVLRVPGPFNAPRMNNLAVRQAEGEFVLLLSNTAAALHADWLSHMMRHALREGVGIVGARLLSPEGTVQHAGVVMGLRGPAGHPYLGLKADEPGYLFRAQVAQNFSAVTAACMLVSKAVYEEAGGLDESVFAANCSDIDFCLRVGRTGRRIVWTPLATLLHEGGASQKTGMEAASAEHKPKRFTKEQAAMYERWPEVIANDPAYNPNLSLVEKGYEVETNPLLCFDKLKGLVEHKVAAFAADPFGCGHYRILQPMQAMRDAGFCSGGASPELFGPNLALRSGADTLVFQRPTTDANLALLESLLPLKGILKVYEVDDDLSRVPMKSAHREHIPKDMRARMMRNIGLCNRLVVSTEFLARQFRGANDDIRVVANRLPRALWGQAPPVVAERQERRKPVVGWAGGVSHQGDLELIVQVVKETASEVDWVFFGMCPESIRPLVKVFHAGVPTLEYPKRLMELARDWDLAVAPLELNVFNEAKSNLRLLEYGWCGLPVVCTDITPYQGDLPAIRVKNRFKDWRNTILETAGDLAAARRLGQSLQERVVSDWVLEGEHLKAWYRAWTDR